MFSMPTGLAKIVIPAKAGIHSSRRMSGGWVGSGLRRDDGIKVAR